MKRVPIQLRVPIISDKQDCCPYEEPFGYIYKITNKINGHYYIGQHEFHYPWLDKSYHGSGRKLWNAYKKYGIENFDVAILEWTDEGNEKLSELEINWIEVFGSYMFPFHYNLTFGGDSGPGVDKDWYNTLRGKTKRKEQSEMLKRNNPMMNSETARKQHQQLIGKKLSKQARLNMSLNHADFSGEKNPMYGVRLTGSKNHKARPIVRLDLDMNLISEHSYMKELEELEGIDPHRIRECCQNKRDSWKGFIYMYKEDYEDYKLLSKLLSK